MGPRSERYERDDRRSTQVDALALFSVLWALAAVWHLLGNPLAAPGWAQALLAAGVALVLLQPGHPFPLAALAAAGLVTLWEEAPVLGNHWLLAGFVNLAVLSAVAAGRVRRGPDERVDLAVRLLPTARLCLLGFYAFAAFAKLNSSFFDRSVSCAVFYLHESATSLGLPTGAGSVWVDRAAMFGTAAIELAIPVLLVRRRTRHAGVVVALVFHAVVALDQAHQFFDFSAILAALFVLFLPPMAGTWVAERLGSVRARLALRDERLPERVHLGLVAVPVTAALLVALDALDPRQALLVGWWPWQLFAFAAVVVTLTFLRQRRPLVAASLRPHHAVFAVVPLLVVLNGLTPYLELKTGYGWNMYANLRAADGESNHLIVRRTLPLTDEQADPVEIISSSDPQLERYADGYALTWRQLRTYLARHPDVAITYRRGSETVALRHAADRPELVEPQPAWREKVQLFRAIDLRDPTRCVPAFGAAR